MTSIRSLLVFASLLLLLPEPANATQTVPAPVAELVALVEENVVFLTWSVPDPDSINHYDVLLDGFLQIQFPGGFESHILYGEVFGDFIDEPLGEYSVIAWDLNGQPSEPSNIVTYGDKDVDTIPDVLDNCSDEPNVDQRDTNADGFGNICDSDLNNDGIVNFPDLGLMRDAFFQTGDIDEDLTGDFVVNVSDLVIMRRQFFGPPGPSGIAP